MARRLTREQRLNELTAVEQAMLGGEWLRPCDLAKATGLNTAVVLSVLRGLALEHKVTRREFLVGRLHQGRDRLRKTSRLVVQYRKVLPLSPFPAWLQPPAPTFTGTIRRVTAR